MQSKPATEFELWNRGGWPRVDVLGEKYHEVEIRRLFSSGFATGSAEYEGPAHLLPEPQNRHDPNAIAVHVEGHVIGYLAKELAARYVGVLSALVREGHIPTTSCQIWAYEHQDWQGTDRRGRDIFRPVLEARASVVLDEPHLSVPANLPPSLPHRLLPLGGALQVKGEEEHLDVLAPLVSQHGEAWAYATLHSMTIGTGKSERRIVELLIDEQPIGHLTPAMSAHYLPAIDHLSQSGHSVAARVMLKGNPIQVEAVLYAARGHQLDAAWLHPPPAPDAATSSPRSEQHQSDEPSPAPAATSQTTMAATGPVSIPPKPDTIVFQAPPGWPPPPAGWEPFPGWQPDPSWPAPPEDWQFWTAR